MRGGEGVQVRGGEGVKVRGGGAGEGSKQTLPSGGDAKALSHVLWNRELLKCGPIQSSPADADADGWPVDSNCGPCWI